MPYKSRAQQRWMHATHPEMAKEWDAHTPDFKALPERAQKPKKSKKKADNPYVALLPAALAGTAGAAYGAYQSPGGSPLRGALIGGMGGAGAGLGLSAANSFLESPMARKLESPGVNSGIVLGGAGAGLSAGLLTGRELAELLRLGSRRDRTEDDLAEIDPAQEGYRMLPKALREYAIKHGSALTAFRPSVAILLATGGTGSGALAGGSAGHRIYRAAFPGPVQLGLGPVEDEQAKKAALQVPEVEPYTSREKVLIPTTPGVPLVDSPVNAASEEAAAMIDQLCKNATKLKQARLLAHALNTPRAVAAPAQQVGAIPKAAGGQIPTNHPSASAWPKMQIQRPWTLRVGGGKSVISQPTIGKAIPQVVPGVTTKPKLLVAPTPLPQTVPMPLRGPVK